MERFTKIENLKEETKIDASDYYRDFIPGEFSTDPIKYFQEKGIQIKEGEPRYNSEGVITEDPTAVVDFPVWENKKGEKIQVVAKRINTEKAQIFKTQNPFHEYRVMQIARHLNLPSPEPIAIVESEKGHMIIMEKVKGLRLVGSDLEYLKQRISKEQIEALKQQAESQMDDLKLKFQRHGIERGFKLTDMIFDIDFDSSDGPKIIKITPVDWERAKIDEKKLSEFIEV